MRRAIFYYRAFYEVPETYRLAVWGRLGWLSARRSNLRSCPKMSDVVSRMIDRPPKFIKHYESIPNSFTTLSFRLSENAMPVQIFVGVLENLFVSLKDHSTEKIRQWALSNANWHVILVTLQWLWIPRQINIHANMWRQNIWLYKYKPADRVWSPVRLNIE